MQNVMSDTTAFAKIDRRRFFQVLGGGLLVLAVSDASEAQQSGRGGAQRGGEPQQIDAWLHIGADGAISVNTGKVELGQNARTSLSQQAAEELHAPLSAIRMVMADTDLVPYDGGTSGSQTTPRMGPIIRRMGAAAREALVEMAAKQWSVSPADLRAEDGRVINPKTGQSLSYGQITKGQNLVRTVAIAPALIPAAEWRVAGKPLPKVTGLDLVTGRHKFPSDIARPGMLFGRVLRAPAYGATLSSLDASAAERIPGVKVVRDGDFAGVTAPSTPVAEQALAALKPVWNPAPAQPSNANLFEYIKQNAQTGGQGRDGAAAPSGSGSIAAALAASDKKLERTYTLAFIQHAPPEPRASVAVWQDGKLTVWTGTSSPFRVQSELTQALSVPAERVRVIVPDCGCSFGGKHSGECAVEAARLAKAAGASVKLVWTREEEFTWAYFRPAGVIEVRSGVRNDGTLTAWEFHNYLSGGAAIATYYDVPNPITQSHGSRSPLRTGSYRSLAAAANHFAREVHMDELAAEVGMDRLAFRVKNLQKNERLRHVFEVAAERFGWGKTKPPKGTGYGIAGGFEKNSYVATCAEVQVAADGKVSVKRVTTAFDCGPAINPDHLRNQIEGAQIMGLGGALFEQVLFENGKILNAGFSKYRVPRFSDVPKFETIIIDRKDVDPAGAGETPICGIAPAIAGAIFEATGVRLRALPLQGN